MIPACWPQHPHLVHEIAVLADQRRRAGHALTSDALEEWHRHNLPAFTERMKSRCGTTAKTATKPGRRKAATPGTWPRSAAAPREDSFAADVGSVRPTEARGRRQSPETVET